MVTGLMIFQATISVFLIILVLLQFGKGAEAGLLSNASDSVFTSSQQGNILSKITTVMAILFLGNSILLARIQSTRTSTSILDNEAPIAAPLTQEVPKEEAAAPEAPTTPATDKK
jgi:preprotein translocase subunit SecG